MEHTTEKRIHNQIVSAVEGITSTHKKVKLVVMAGHFALIPHVDRKPESTKLIPAIHQDAPPGWEKHIRNHPFGGEFPLATFQMGTRLFAKLNKEPAVRCGDIVLIVNDSQRVPSTQNGKENTLRRRYFQDAEVPKSYLTTLSEAGLCERTFIPYYSSDGRILHRWAWKETALRRRFKQTLKGQCSLTHGCAQEAVPYMRMATDEYLPTIFINFVPMTCKEPWGDGSEEALEHLPPGSHIINIFCPIGCTDENRNIWRGSKMEMLW